MAYMSKNRGVATSLVCSSTHVRCVSIHPSTEIFVQICFVCSASIGDSCVVQDTCSFFSIQRIFTPEMAELYQEFFAQNGVNLILVSYWLSIVPLVLIFWGPAG